MKNFKHLLSVLGILVLSAFLYACEEGAFEEAGENIDQAAEETGERLEDVCEAATDEDC